jgi:DNA-binding NtrC family response regulator
MHSRVLVVDDDPEVRLLVRIGLERRGFQVREASNARTALAELAAPGADVIVLDHDLRDDVTGVDLAKVIAVAAPATRVILFSAYLEPDVVLPGVDAVLNKRDFRLVADCIDALPERATPPNG